jgi:hypothetical protein
LEKKGRAERSAKKEKERVDWHLLEIMRRL